MKYNEELEENEEKMSYEELNYLLKDLDQKLDVKIIPAPATLFGKKKAVAEVPTCNATLLARMDSQQVMKKVALCVFLFCKQFVTLFLQLRRLSCIYHTCFKHWRI